MSQTTARTTYLCAALLCAILFAHPGQSAEEVALPRGVKICQSAAPDYSSCLRLALQESWMTFVKGIPELEIPILDPLVVELIENDYNAGEVLGKFVLRDVKSYGMAKTNFLAVRPYRSGNTMNMQIDIEIPKVFVDGNYKAEGTVGPFKIGGKGYFNISMEAISATWSLEGHIENDRWVIEHFHVDPELEKMHVYFDDLFNGNKELNSAAMSFVNEYWPVLYKGMLPTVEKQWDFHLTEYVNKMIFSKISASKSFP